MTEKASTEEIESLLKYQLAIELWRGGLTQHQIRTRLEISTTTVTGWLKGVSREVEVTTKAGK